MLYQIFFAISLGFVFSNFFSSFSYFSSDIHKLCLEYSPHSPFQTLYSAIVCGKKLEEPDQFLTLKQLGIIHIVIVSGAHLLFLSRLLRLISFQLIPQIITLIILFIFVLCCQIQMPALRAWIFVITLTLSKKLKLFNSHPLNILLSILFCLTLDLQSFFKISLPLSWLASLALYIGRNSFTQSVLCYFLLLPVLFNFQFLHPWTILINAFLTPVLCFFLFPMSLLSFFFSFLIPWTDQLWEGLFKLSSILSSSMKTADIPTSTPSPLLNWLYPSLLNLFLIFKIRDKNDF